MSNLPEFTPAAANPVQQGPKRTGRRAPLPTYFFEGVGIEVQIKRLGPFTLDEIRKTLLKERKAPKPPVVLVEVGEDKVKLKEENPHDPDFIKETIEYNEWLNSQVAERMINLMINYCIVCEVESDVVEERRAMLGIIGADISEQYSDREVYVRHYLLSTADDLDKVQRFILGQSMPTQEAVQEHIDTFPGGVQGEGPLQTPGSPIRVPIQ